MMFLEMARDETHGGGTWSFPNCVWAPTEKKGEAGRWPFWEKVLNLRAGDSVLHLKGIPPAARFVGHSTVATDGFETSRRPPDPGEWAYAKSFYKADLHGFVPFHNPINLTDVFSARQSELIAYFDANRTRRSDKRNIFFVRQAGRLQCLNGAYLSDFDEELFDAIFGAVRNPNGYIDSTALPVTIETGWQLSTVKARLGQTAFARSVKELYDNNCCFPSCGVDDPRFLVASHIARWSDNEKLRGHLGNGLCFCLMHDKAFEIGLFTLDENHRVFVNAKEVQNQGTFLADLQPYHGSQIRLAKVRPLDDAILEHWIRVDLSP
jgi:putative restriction endonuclease